MISIVVRKEFLDDFFEDIVDEYDDVSKKIIEFKNTDQQDTRDMAFAHYSAYRYLEELSMLENYKDHKKYPQFDIKSQAEEHRKEFYRIAKQIKLENNVFDEIKNNFHHPEASST